MRVLLQTTVLGIVLTAAAAGPLFADGHEAEARVLRIPARAFQVVERESGEVNYYTVVEDSEGDFIRSLYRPPLETTVLAVEVPERLRQSVKKVRWRWRALAVPKGGNECRPGYADSAAVVYVTFKRGLKWYSLKYVWSSADAKKGAVCDKKRNPFIAQDTIIVEASGPTADWRSVEIDPRADFRNHFEDGDPNADVPDLAGIGIMSDGDQTLSLSSADYGDFQLVE